MPLKVVKLRYKKVFLKLLSHKKLIIYKILKPFTKFIIFINFSKKKFFVFFCQSSKLSKIKKFQHSLEMSKNNFKKSFYLIHLNKVQKFQGIFKISFFKFFSRFFLKNSMQLIFKIFIKYLYVKRIVFKYENFTICM